MTKDEILKELIKQKIIRESYGEYFIIKKKSVSKTKGNLCKNLPSKYSGVSITVAMNYFFEDAQIPAFQKSKDIEYELRTVNKKSLKIFHDIILDSSINFNTLVTRTKNYYSSPKTVKKGMANYFIDGSWKTVYDSYEGTIDTGNTFFV